MSDSNERTPLLQGAIDDVQKTQLESPKPSRQIAPDLLRGLICVFMAIDHCNAGLHAYHHGTNIDGELSSTIVTQFTGTGPYILRTLSHFAAPGFFLLLGMGLAYFVASRALQSWSRQDLLLHVATRAFVLMLVNIAISLPIMAARPILFMNLVMFGLAIDYFIVGLTYVLLYPYLQRMSSFVNYVFDALAIVTATILLWSTIWLGPGQGDCSKQTGNVTSLCNEPGRLTYRVFLYFFECPRAVSYFPPLPWLPMTLFGLVYGRVLLRTPRKASAPINASIGVFFALLFVSTRLFQYGNLSTNCLQTIDQARQTANGNQYLASLRSFFYIVKYPPSVAFTSFALSGCFLFMVLLGLLAHFDLTAWIGTNYSPLVVFGGQPLFFYYIHINILVFGVPLAINHRLSMPDQVVSYTGLGFQFWASLVVGLAITYVLCLCYGRWKAGKGKDSVWRFL